MSGEVSLSAKHFCSFTAKQHCSILQKTTEAPGENVNKQLSSYSLYPESPEVFKVVANLKALALTPSEVVAQLPVKDVNSVFSNHFDF